MPDHAAAPRDKNDSGITFIVGNHRSRQNLSKIRRHASKAPKTDGRPATLPHRPKESPIAIPDTPRRNASPDRLSPQSELDTSTPRPPPSASYPSSIDLPRASSLTLPPAWEQLQPRSQRGSSTHVNAVQRPAPHVELPNNLEKEGVVVSHDGQAAAFLLPSPRLRRLRGLPLPQIRHSASFTTQGTAIDTWLERCPTKQAIDALDPQFDPHKRAKLSNQTHSGEGVDDFVSRQPLLPQLPHSDSVDAISHQSIVDSLPPRKSSSLDVHGVSQKGHDNHARLPKRRFDVLQTKWRIGAAPSRALALSDEHTSFEHIIYSASAYYHGRFDSTWRSLLERSPTNLDSDGRVACLYESNLTTAALIEAGLPGCANVIIEGNLSVMEDLLRSEHPRLFSVLSVMALDASPSVLGQFHQKFTAAIIPLAKKVLGAEHPCTLLLQCNLPLGTKAQLREAIQKRIHEVLLATFGDAHQTHEGFFITGRIMAHLGHIEEALGVLAWLKPRMEAIHGMNSIIAVWILLDEASIYLGAGQADVRTEMIISDALRRLQILQAGGRHLPEHERDRVIAGTTYPRVGALRALGKMHVMRRNYGAALESYRQALNLAKAVFGVQAPPTQLAQGDFDRAKVIAKDGFFERFGVQEKAEEDEEEIETIDTVLGPIARSRAPFGKEPVRIPIDKAPVYGLVPYEDLRWREGLIELGSIENDQPSSSG